MNVEAAKCGVKRRSSVIICTQRTISIVAPSFNEEENLPEFRRRVTDALETVGEPLELILVNDGSRDRSECILRRSTPKIRA